MNDMRKVIEPRSDQMNADDLLAGPVTITIRDVSIRPGTEQPVSIHFDGDNGKPWKPCKSMCRVLVAAWGPDAKAYVGRSATLYCDPKVKWAGLEVGGIRISHLSHIDREMMMALTATKGKRAPYMVKPLVGAGDDEILKAAREAAKKGNDALNQCAQGSNDSTRAILNKHRAELRQIAAEADAATKTAQEQKGENPHAPTIDAIARAVLAARTEAEIDAIAERHRETLAALRETDRGAAVCLSGVFQRRRKELE